VQPVLWTGRALETRSNRCEESLTMPSCASMYVTYAYLTRAVAHPLQITAQLRGGAQLDSMIEGLESLQGGVQSVQEGITIIQAEIEPVQQGVEAIQREILSMDQGIDDVRKGVEDVLSQGVENSTCPA
jgi:translation elongation factor EF-1beta